MKKIATGLAVLVLAFAGWYVFGPDDDGEDTGDKAARLMLDTALKVSKLDATFLAKVSDRLEEKCAQNRFGLSEEDCVHALRTRTDLCIADTAQKYPGEIGNTDQMQVVVKHYAGCLFQKPEN